MYNKLKKLCKEKDTNVTKLCEIVTGSSGNLATWKKGYMRSDYLIKAAEYLGVSTDYLLGIDEEQNKKEKSSTSELTDLEQRMLAAFREVSYDDKMIEIGRLELLVEKLSQKGV